jgi:thymidylate synthase
MDIEYKDLLRRILRENSNLSARQDRTGVGTLSVFGHMMCFNLQDGFPAQTTKKLAWKSVVGELLWFLEGSSNERRLAEITYGKPRCELKDKSTIWTANADKQGVELGYCNNENIKQLGPVYGVQWRNFGQYTAPVDQIKTVIGQLKNDPYSRRIILSAWNPAAIDRMALPPCHMMCQFRVDGGKLSCLMTQRSCDVFLGLPFNVASYALLTHILARECGYDVGKLIISLGDAHIYMNHIEQVNEVLERDTYDLPTLKIDPEFNLQKLLNGEGDYTKIVNYFKLINYEHHEAIKADMAV